MFMIITILWLWWW